MKNGLFFEKKISKNNYRMLRNEKKVILKLRHKEKTIQKAPRPPWGSAGNENG
jgi:hypothetical protein